MTAVAGGYPVRAAEGVKRVLRTAGCSAGGDARPHSGEKSGATLPGGADVCLVPEEIPPLGGLL